MSTESSRREFAHRTLKSCSRKLTQLKQIQSIAARAAKNLDNAYYSIKLAVDANDMRRYQTGFSGY